jgi:hypothetical protein
MDRRKIALLTLCLSMTLAAPASAGQPPSRLQTMAASLLIPGWGQKIQGHTGRAQAFFGAELGIWTAYVVFQVQGRLRKESYMEIAEVLGGVQNARGANEEYYRWLGRYPSVADYLRDVRRDARARYGNDLEARRAYEASHAIPPERAWAWPSEEARERYRRKRSDSERAYHRARYMIAAALANRILSVMDAARSHARGADRAWSLRVRPDPDLEGPLQICFTTSLP